MAMPHCTDYYKSYEQCEREYADWMHAAVLNRKSKREAGAVACEKAARRTLAVWVGFASLSLVIGDTEADALALDPALPVAAE